MKLTKWTVDSGQWTERCEEVKMNIQSYRDLSVWQKSMELVKSTYEIINYLPKDERFALADQMRRSVISIPSNIAEGYERQTTKEYIQFLFIANASRAELETQLEICKMLEYFESKDAVDDVIQSCKEIAKLINAIIKKLNQNN